MFWMKETKEKRSVKDLLQENEELHAQIEFLQKQNGALRFRCATYSRKNMELEAEIRDMKFTRDYLTSEDAGKAFAQDLLGNMTPGDIAEEEFISQGEQHYADTWNINCGDDF